MAVVHNPGLKIGEAITELGPDNSHIYDGVPVRETRWLWLTFRSEGTTTTITVDKLAMQEVWPRATGSYKDG